MSASEQDRGQRAREVWEDAFMASWRAQQDGRDGAPAAEAIISAALEQTDAASYRRGIIELRNNAGKKWRGCLFGDGSHEGITVDDLYDEADRLLSSAPEAGDRHRELREAFVAGARLLASGLQWQLNEDKVQAAALRRWPLSEPGVPK